MKRPLLLLFLFPSPFPGQATYKKRGFGGTLGNIFNTEVPLFDPIEFINDDYIYVRTQSGWKRSPLNTFN